MTLAPVRRATSPQKAGPSSPCSWTIVSPIPSTIPATSSSVALTNTPQTWARRRTAAAMRAASAGSHARGEPGHRMQPDRPRTGLDREQRVVAAR